jgi:glycosyltransferase involved in cell wall biosynthesis
MFVFKEPSWVKQHIYPYSRFGQIPQNVFEDVNGRLALKKSESPLVSIVISAWNEEVNILNCVSSLSCLETDVPFEIIVVNNNSSDDTHLTLSKLNVVCLFQEVQGCGPARQLGQLNAKGKYILLADADCIYPPCWLDSMLKEIQEEGVVCVYGRYSFLPERDYPRWKLFVFESMKDMIAEIRHVKRPYLNAYGISMGYIRDLGIKVGFVDYKIWGDDGRLCFDLMKFGKVKQNRSQSARVWTSPRTLQRDGSFSGALKLRIKKECSRIFSMFVAHPPHDTKVSRND